MKLELLDLVRNHPVDEVVLPTNAESVIGAYYNEAAENSFALSVLVDGASRRDDKFDRKYRIGPQILGMATYVDIDAKAAPILRDAGEEVEFGSLSLKQSDNLHASDLARLARISNQQSTPAEVDNVYNTYLEMFKAFGLRNARAKQHFIWTAVTTGTGELPIADTANSMLVDSGVVPLPDLVGGDKWDDYDNSNPQHTLDEMSHGKNTLGLRPITAVMNQVTYNHMVRSKNLLNQHGTPVTDIVDRPWGREENLIGRHNITVINREGYIDHSKNFQEYLEDGIVLYLCEGDVARIVPVELPNVDRNHGEGNDLAYSYGGKFTVDSAGNPRRDAYFHTDYFGYDVLNPKGFVVQRVF